MIAILSLGVVVVAITLVVGFYLVTPPVLEQPIVPTTPTTEVVETIEEQGGVELSPLVEPSPTLEPITAHLDVITIDEQPVRVYTPSRIETDQKVTLIIYSHGSNENVDPALITQTFNETLETYGTYFSEKGAIFIASELYGQNWGNQESREHIKHIIEYFNSEYSNKTTVHVYGFSMGGLAALRFARDYPEMVDSVLLLAPTIAMDDWTTENLNRIAQIPITLWHGTSDVNVPFSQSQEFITKFNTTNSTTINFISVQGETHRHFVTPQSLLTEIKRNS
ncbi:dienelactone hydrolase family protein [candidate division WWE3 bacterium]|uniref:Dienelactone hydrolase family protein n=1 Tax=candidate division WWE3 bacterium TaxID=2053526 RepID=A0A955LGP6_UNCKA|nr:dienelactone hydrolase family protein [candidate division WWE3 bacterium]